ncbi:hypothetical protein Taro_034687 [Colocasia esculenta]|uniref:Uncharacterized protein n=1 Tax=Colocasia esculenta TaxID=4460 RepID=A0A843W3L7_COLES|nr:hypothetical protein [Colocasia esculenta]
MQAGSRANEASVRAAWCSIAIGHPIATGSTVASTVVSTPALARRHGAIVESYVPGPLAVPVVPTDVGKRSVVCRDGSRGAATTDPAGSTSSARGKTSGTAAPEDRMALLERFLCLWPPMFYGDYDPDKAESWVHELDRTFETMDCADQDQVRLAVYQLKGGESYRLGEGVLVPATAGRRLDEVYPVPVTFGQSRECVFFFFFGDRRCWPDLEAEEEFFATLTELAPEQTCDLAVELPTGDYMHTLGYLEGVTIEVQGDHLLARLFTLQLHDFDAILNMDWLEAHSVLVDCQQKTVRFEIPGAPVLCFRVSYRLRDRNDLPHNDSLRDCNDFPLITIR